MSKNIIGALLVLVALVVVYFVARPEFYSSKEKSVLSDGFRAWKNADFKDAAKIVLEKGKGKVELKKEGDGWVVASSWSYPADKEQVDKLLKSLGQIVSGEEAGRSEGSHADFEVDKETGGFVSVYDASDKLLGKVVVGKYAPGGGISSNRVFARFGDDVRTYNVESDLRSEARLYNKDVEGKSFLKTEVVKLPEDVEVETVRLVRPEKPDLIVERRFREVPEEKKEETKEEGEKKEGEAAAEAASKAGEAKEEKKEEPKTKKEPYYVVTSGSEVHEVGKSEEWNAKGLLDRGKSVRVEDAAEPKELATYGLDKPQLKAVVAYRKKDDPNAELQRVTLLFGNAKKDDKGNTEDYYFVLETDPAHVYLVRSWNYDGWNKELKDFLPKPKEEEKKAEAKPEGKPETESGAKPAEAKAEAPAEAPSTVLPPPEVPPSPPASPTTPAPEAKALPESAPSATTPPPSVPAPPGPPAASGSGAPSAPPAPASTPAPPPPPSAEK